MQNEAAWAERRSLRPNKAEEGEVVQDVSDSWTADYLQFSMWMNSDSQIADRLNIAAAALQWPEPEPEDLDILLEEDAVVAIWEQIDWEDDGKVGEKNLGALSMLVAGKIEHDLSKIFEQIDSNEYGLFDQTAFSKWVNSDLDTASDFRKLYRDRTHSLKLASAKAGAAVAAAAATKASKYAMQGASAAGRALRKGGVPLTVITAKGAFGVTKVALTATARITGVGGTLMEGLEKVTTDKRLTREQIENVWQLLDMDQNGVLTSKEILRLRTHLGIRLNDEELRHVRKELGANPSSMLTSQDSNQMAALEASGCTLSDFALWINITKDSVAKKVRVKARAVNDFDYVSEARELAEELARLRAFKSPDVWLSGDTKSSIKSKDLIGSRVDVRGYGEGTVLGYQKARRQHYVDFDIAGTHQIKLDPKKVIFRTSSAKFVEEFVDLAIEDFELEEKQARQDAEDAAISSVMSRPDAWSLGRSFEDVPMDLIGKVISIDGKMAQVLSYSSKKGHDVQFDASKKLNTLDLQSAKFRVLNDDYLMTNSQPLVEAAMAEWGQAQIADFQAQRSKIRQSEDAEYAEKLRLYTQAQAAQALADAVAAAVHWTYIQRKAYSIFCVDFRPSCEAMDPELIHEAGGIDAILHQTWTTLSADDRAACETQAIKNSDKQKLIRLPTFDEAYAEQLAKEEDSSESVVDERLLLDDDTLDIIMPFSMTGATREQLRTELGSGAADIRFEDFAAWIGAKTPSNIAIQLKRQLAQMRWPSLGPLLVYQWEPEETKTERVRFAKFKYMGRGGLQLTKFTLKGSWVITKVAGKVAIPVTKTALKATTIASDLAEKGLTHLEKQVVEADATQVKALFSWLHEELGVVTTMAVIALTPGELNKSLEELGLENVDDEQTVGIRQFAQWFVGRSKLAHKLMNAVSERTAAGDNEPAPEPSKAERKKNRKEEKKKLKELAREEKKSLDMLKSSDSIASESGSISTVMNAQERFEVIKNTLHEELERIDQAYESYMSWGDFERLIKELEGEDGEVSFEGFLSWICGDRTKGTLAKLTKVLAEMDARDADAVELAAQNAAAAKVAAKAAAIDSIFSQMDPDERSRISRDKFERLGVICGGIELSVAEKKRALRALDPTNLGFIKESNYLQWMELPTNRLAPKLLAGLASTMQTLDSDEDLFTSDSDLEVSQLGRYLFDCLDSERDGEYIPIHALQQIPQIAGIKLSKAELASLKSNHILDPENYNDCYVGNLDRWLWCDEKLPTKILSALQKDGNSGHIPRGISEDFANELRQERQVQDLFQTLSSGEELMQADSLDKLNELHAISRAEISRCAVSLDPNETGFVSAETWTTWMNQPNNRTAATIFGHSLEVDDGTDADGHVAFAQSESKMSDEELKSLFLMLNVAGDGQLTKSDWNQVDLILNIRCSDEDIASAMIEMSRFSRAEDNVDIQTVDAGDPMNVSQQQGEKLLLLYFCHVATCLITNCGLNSSTTGRIH